MDPIADANLDGICDNCAYVGGIAGTNCPFCGQILSSLDTEKPSKKTVVDDEETDDGRYDPDELKTVSLDELADEELSEEMDETL